MPWGRMDDKWHRRRDVAALRRQGQQGLAALGLWSVSVSSALDDPELDGFVHLADLSKGEQKLALLLKNAGLFQPIAHGYQIVDFQEIAPTREQVEHKREADRLRIAEKRAAERQASRAPVAGDSQAGRLPARDPTPLPDPDPDPDPDPKPDPTPALFPRAGAGDRGRAEPAEETAQTALTFDGAAPDDPALAPEAPGSGLARLRSTCASIQAEQSRQRAAARAAWGDMKLGHDLSTPPADQAWAGQEPANDDGHEAANVLSALSDSDEDLRHEFSRRVYQRFLGLYQGTFNEYPSMGGRNVDAFPERLRQTARLREIDPLELLERTFRVFATEPLDEIGRRAPYATFVARFGGYLAKPQAKALGPKDALRAKMLEAMAKSDTALYERLDSEYRTTYLGGRDARPAG